MFSTVAATTIFTAEHALDVFSMQTKFSMEYARIDSLLSKLLTRNDTSMSAPFSSSSSSSSFAAAAAGGVSFSSSQATISSCSSLVLHISQNVLSETLQSWPSSLRNHDGCVDSYIDDDEGKKKKRKKKKKKKGGNFWKYIYSSFNLFSSFIII